MIKMIIGIIVISIIITFIGGYIWCESWEHEKIGATLCIISILILIGTITFGFFNGFINRPKTEGIHNGTITAVDLEGIFFRRYEVYIKSGGFSRNGNDSYSDETKYCLYEYEKDLVDKIRSAVGKQVKLEYGHDGGYIGWKSCGTYHIKSVEIIDNVEGDKDDNGRI